MPLRIMVGVFTGGTDNRWYREACIGWEGADSPVEHLIKEIEHRRGKLPK